MKKETKISKSKIRKILRDEGGAAGLKSFLDEFGKENEKDIKHAIDSMEDVGKHKNGDYILDDGKSISVKENIVKLFMEKKKKKKKKKKKSSGKKDACYHKVKSRYAVWPSAYASGALVKCRKVGAKNWGNKSKKNENTEIDKLVDEEFDAFLTERCQKGYKTHPKRKTKKMFGRTYRNCVKAEEGNDPAKGTGKKPKGSGRRLYTDEDPSDTVSVKFSSVSDIQDTLSKASFKSKSHKRQSQIINLIHQRVRAAYNNAKDPKVKARLKKAFDYAKKRKEASKEKTKRMKDDK